MAKKVTLELGGLKKFRNVLGANGITFRPGLHNKVQAQKGAALEFGTDTQPPRPWLSSITVGKTRDSILRLMPKLVQDALKGKDSRKETERRITNIVKNHLESTSFTAEPLKASTIAAKKRHRKRKGRKDLKPSSTPDKIGVDNRSMLNSISTKSTGGRK